MLEVSWSWDAERDLESSVSDPAVRDQLRRNAEKILHNIPPRTFPDDEGAGDGGIMWHRGVSHELPEQPGGPQNYFLFYRRRNPAPGFEVRGVRSTHQIASRLLDR
jgi:hypothetical protein